MDRWEKFDETSLSYQKAFCSELSLEDIIDKDCIHDQKLFKEFKLKDLGEYHDLKVIHYCFQMYLKTLEMNVLKHANLIPLFLSAH